jgi:hypothetical protein
VGVPGERPPASLEGPLRPLEQSRQGRDELRVGTGAGVVIVSVVLEPAGVRLVDELLEALGLLGDVGQQLVVERVLEGLLPGVRHGGEGFQEGLPLGGMDPAGHGAQHDAQVLEGGGTEPCLHGLPEGLERELARGACPARGLPFRPVGGPGSPTVLMLDVGSHAGRV